jgi:ribonuclease HII
MLASQTSHDLGPPGAELCAGLDENGLGPLLGPLVVTAVTAIAETPRAAKLLLGPPRGKLATLAGDSKRLVRFGDSDLGRLWAKALAASNAPGPLFRTPLLESILLDPMREQTRMCPAPHERQCWNLRPSAGEGDDDAAFDAIAGALLALAKKGAHITRVQSVVVCTKRLNLAKAAGKTRLDCDLLAMERLMLAAPRAERATFVCGKVGGLMRYRPVLQLLGERPMVTLREAREESAYKVEGLGHVRFLKDAEDQCLLVSLASLVGKWVRDTLMRGIVRYHQEVDATLPNVSGYHDPITLDFVRRTEPQRLLRVLPDTCFLRE